jgi:hypothetical protein
MDRANRLLVFGVAVLGAVALFAVRGEAHKPITSKYTYNDDVFPIFKARCSRCHVQGGVAPMSLMTYEEAFPWAESIRAELVAAHMPPATVDGSFGTVAHSQGLSPKDVDVILTWASGGNPRGSLDQKLPPVVLNNDWTLGKPDLALPLPSEYTLAADKMEDVYEVVLPTGTSEARWVRGVDLLPGNPAIVRSAVVSVKGAEDRILARWLPGQDPQEADAGTAFRLPAGAELSVRIHYKKTWSYEGKVMKDRSTIGIYFAPDGAERELMPVRVTSPDIASTKGQTFTFEKVLDHDVQAFAVSPEQVPDNVTLTVEAVRPDGSRTPLIRFDARPDWKRRYWFAEGLSLPRGTKIEVKGTVGDPDLVAAAFGGPVSADKAAAASRIALALDVVPASEKASVP